jgi:hypothetical protein
LYIAYWLVIGQSNELLIVPLSYFQMVYEMANNSLRKWKWLK